MSAKVYQYAIIEHPTETDKEDGAKSVLVKGVETVIAETPEAAMLMAARAIPEEYADKVDRLEVAVRPF